MAKKTESNTAQKEPRVIVKHMYLHRQLDGREELYSVDMTNGGTDAGWVTAVGACIGKVEVRMEYQSIDRDPREALIESLEKAVESEKVESQKRQNALLDQISKLRCLSHEG